MYAIGLPAGACALQRVETRIRFLRGERVLAAYRSLYWEYFQAGRDPDEARHDVHDFDVERDGWGSGPIARLLRRRGLDPSGGGGLARLECEKRFLLAPGQVEDAEPCLRTAEGGAFGYLAEVEGEATCRWLHLDQGEHDASEVATPLPGPVAGRGRLAGGPGWEAVERLSFELATLTGQVEVVPYRSLI